VRGGLLLLEINGVLRQARRRRGRVRPRYGLAARREASVGERVRHPAAARYDSGGGRGSCGQVRQQPAPVSVHGSPL
jgi:hypothetical protein